jgi:hypothetical protein
MTKSQKKNSDALASHSPVLAPDYAGMRVSASGVLTRKQSNKGLNYMREEMYKHLQIMAEQYYIGNTRIVDDFCQLYCLGEKRREAAKERLKEGRK